MAATKRRFEIGGDALVHDETLGGDAGLAVVDGAGLGGHLGGTVEIGAGHDDERVAAAQFENGLLDLPARCGRHLRAGGLAAGEGGGANARIVQHPLPPGRKSMSSV